MCKTTIVIYFAGHKFRVTPGDDALKSTTANLVKESTKASCENIPLQNTVNIPEEINPGNFGQISRQPQPSKNITPCPFLFSKGWCAKGDHCDCSHRNNDQRNFNIVPKHLVPCPFLQKRGFCLKGSSCDFFHAPMSKWSTGGNHFQDDYNPPFLGKINGIMNMMNQVDTRLRTIESSNQPQQQHFPQVEFNKFR